MELLKKIICCFILILLSACSFSTKQASYFFNLSEENKCVGKKREMEKIDGVTKKYSIVECEKVNPSIQKGSLVSTRINSITDCECPKYLTSYADCYIVERQNNILKIECEKNRSILKSEKITMKLKRE